MEKQLYFSQNNKYNGNLIMKLLINNDDHRRVVKNALKEMSGACTRIDAEKDFIKDVLQRLKDEIGLEPKYGRKLLNHYHNQSLQQHLEETEEIEQLYTSVFENN